jgi:hypothetical protein
VLLLVLVDCIDDRPDALANHLAMPDGDLDGALRPSRAKSSETHFLFPNEFDAARLAPLRNGLVMARENKGATERESRYWRAVGTGKEGEGGSSSRLGLACGKMVCGATILTREVAKCATK